jgi:hypothetical protein
VVCRSTQDKRSLVRIARLPNGSICVDPTGKGPGRGAYLCLDPACWSDERLAQRLGRALRVAVTAANMVDMAETAADLLKDTGDGSTSD